MIYWPLLTSNSLKWAVFQVCILAIESLPHLDNKCILLSYFTVQNRFKIKILIGSQMRDFMKEHLKLPKKKFSSWAPINYIFEKNACSLYVHDCPVYAHTYCRRFTVKLLLDPIVWTHLYFFGMQLWLERAKWELASPGAP